MDYLTAQDIADRLGVKLTTVHRYRSRGDMPSPDRMFGRTPVWRASTIERWDRPGRGSRRDMATK